MSPPLAFNLRRTSLSVFMVASIDFRCSSFHMFVFPLRSKSVTCNKGKHISRKWGCKKEKNARSISQKWEANDLRYSRVGTRLISCLLPTTFTWKNGRIEGRKRRRGKREHDAEHADGHAVGSDDLWIGDAGQRSDGIVAGPAGESGGLSAPGEPAGQL